MTKFKLINHDRGNEREFDTKAEAEEKKQEMAGLGAPLSELKIKAIDASEASEESDGSSMSQAAPKTGNTIPKGLDETTTDGGQTAEVVQEPPEPVDTQEVSNPEDLSKNPIGFLRNVNTDFVNTIKGKPAISKQGFRFIQREFEISTQSEVVEWSEDPLGCVVWAKAELPGGYSAEAHGEGYQFESDVSDNEFVRYADTRAKNRAISDLTSAGALAVSELQE